MEAPEQTLPMVNSSEELIAQFSGELNAILSRNVLSAIDQEKTYQYLTIRRNHLYFKGVQSAPTLEGGVADYGPVSGLSSLGVKAGNFDESPYDYNVNIYRGYVRKFVSVLGQRAPNVSCAPRTDGDEQQIDIPLCHAELHSGKTI